NDPWDQGLPVGDVAGRFVAIAAGWKVDTMGVDERHARQLPGSGARQEAVHWVCEINDVLIVKSVALESPQGTDTILEEAPGHGGARYWIDGFVKVVEDGGRENGTQGAGVFEFPETVNIEIRPPGELVETIG